MRDQFTRRQFLYSSGMSLGALLAAGCARRPESAAEGAGSSTGAAGASGASAAATPAAGDAAGGRVAQIGLQLYTVRDLLAKDMAGTLKSLAAVGYKQVEFAGYNNHSAQDVRAMLDANGMTAPSAHVPLDAMRADMNKVVADAKVVGHEIVICPYLPAPPTSGDGWKKLADELTGFATTCQQAGLQFAYHNHDFEFKPAGGKLPYDILLEGTDPKLVKMEMDLYWMAKAGQDPLAYFGRYPGRFPAVHVKDMSDMKGKQAMAPVGTGEIDFPHIFAQANQAGIQHYIVEHDNAAEYAGGALASVRTSYGNLARLLA
jgi:sugar phosphate isomerase/epimerase